MRTTAELRRLHAPACGGEFVTTAFGEHGARIRVRPYTLPFWEAFEQLCASHGYAIRRDDTGSYNCRAVTAGIGYSLHAYGIAVDVNWSTNPYARRLVTDLPAGLVSDVKAVRTKGGHQVFRWGGDYSTFKDPMHFEVVASPEELASGAAGFGRSSQRELPAGAKARDWFGIGDKGEQVRCWQAQLNQASRAGLAVDGAFGPATLASTRRFQSQARVQVDGKVGPVTRAAMRRALAPRRMVLRRGATGDAVIELECRLNQAMLGSQGFPLNPDGYFGVDTEAGVKLFQAARHIDVDGIAGPQTFAALDAVAT